MKQITHSPLTNNLLEPFLEVKDYTVSNKSFTILMDVEADILITSPRPKDEDLQAYYKSDTYISHTDSRKGFLDSVYQWVRTYTLQQKLKLINSFQVDDKKLLDVGCGTGDFLQVCKQHNWKVTGVEPNLGANTIASQKSNAHIADSLDAVSEKFDVITLWHVLEHVPDLNAYVSKLKALLKDNGVLVVAVPNFKSYDASYYKRHWAAFDVPRHLWHFSQKSIRLLFAKHSIKIVATKPMYFDSFYVSILSEKYRNGSLPMISAFYRGLLSNIKALRSKEYSSLIYILKRS